MAPRPRTGRVVKCDHCGEEVYKSAYHLKHARRHFCGNACRIEGALRKDMAARKTGKVISCETCGKEIYKPRLQLLQKHHYCSRACAGKGNTRLRLRMRKYQCEECGNEFERPINREKFSIPKYCTRECAQRGRVGENHPHWEGGRQKRGDGYVDVARSQVPDEFGAMRRKCGRVFEHRLVMAQHLERPLEDHEVVHHINGDRSDNRIENLELYPRYEHDGVTQSTSAKQNEIDELKAEIERLQNRISELED